MLVTRKISRSRQDFMKKIDFLIKWHKSLRNCSKTRKRCRLQHPKTSERCRLRVQPIKSSELPENSANQIARHESLQISLDFNHFWPNSIQFLKILSMAYINRGLCTLLFSSKSDFVLTTSWKDQETRRVDKTPNFNLKQWRKRRRRAQPRCSKAWNKL